MANEPITLDLLFRAMTKGFADVHLHSDKLEKKMIKGFMAVDRRFDRLDEKLSTRIDMLDRKLSTQIDNIDKRLDDLELAFVPERMERVERHLKLPKYIHRPQKKLLPA